MPSGLKNGGPGIDFSLKNRSGNRSQKKHEIWRLPASIFPHFLMICLMMSYCFVKHRRKGRTPRLYWPCQYIQGSGPLKEHKQIIKKPSKNQRNFGNDFSSIFERFLVGFWGVWLWFGLQNTSKNQ